MSLALLLAKLSLLGLLATFLPLFAGLRRGRLALSGGLAVFAVLLAVLALRLVEHNHASLGTHLLVYAATGLLLVAALAGLTWLAWRFPRWAVPVMVAVMPLRVHVPGIAGGANLLLPLYFTALAIVLAEVVVRDRLRWPADLPRDWVRVALAIFMAIAGLTTLWVGLHYAAHEKAFEAALVKLFAFYLPFAVVYYLVYRYVASWKDLRRLLGGFLASGAVLALVGLAQEPTHLVFVNRAKVLHQVKIEGVFRINSLFYDPNMFGRYMVVVALVAFAAMLFVNRPRHRWGLGFLSLVATVALLLTYSRSSWLALVSGAILFAFVWLGRRRGLIIMLVALVVMAGGLLAYSGARRSTFTMKKVETLAGLNKLTGGRALLIRGGWHMFRRHPEGIGLGGFPLAFHDYRPYHRVRGGLIRPVGAANLTESHTTVITVLAEEGVEGIVAFLALLAIYFWRAWTPAALRHDRRLRLLQGAFMASALAILVHSFFYNAFFEDPTVWVVMAASMALTCRLSRLALPRPDSVSATGQSSPETGML